MTKMAAGNLTPDLAAANTTLEINVTKLEDDGSQDGSKNDNLNSSVPNSLFQKADLDSPKEKKRAKPSRKNTQQTEKSD